MNSLIRCIGLQKKMPEMVPRLLSGVMDGGELGHRKGESLLVERQVMS